MSNDICKLYFLSIMNHSLLTKALNGLSYSYVIKRKIEIVHVGIKFMVRTMRESHKITLSLELQSRIRNEFRNS